MSWQDQTHSYTEVKRLPNSENQPLELVLAFPACTGAESYERQAEVTNG